MKISITPKEINEVSADIAIAFVYQGAKLSGDALILDRAVSGSLSRLILQDGFEAKTGQCICIPILQDTGKVLLARKIAVVGLGNKKMFTLDVLRRVGATVAKMSHAAKAEKIICSMPESSNIKDAQKFSQAFAEGVLLSSYRFHTYHGTQKKKDPKQKELKEVYISESRNVHAKNSILGITQAETLVQATNMVRDLVNLTSADVTPLVLAQYAKKIIGKNISVEILSQEKMKKLGMMAALAVARGSVHPAVGVHIVYKPSGAKKRIALVGKAVTFDSGGLSLKPADKMHTMKCDMAGAATVIGVCSILEKLKLHVEVHGIFLAVENMPGGNAYRPGDIVTAMDGTTIEVLNTDAEGRVTLADALTYAKSFSPDVIIDLATLTGACIVALGEDIAAVLSNDKKLAKKLLDAADETGEPLWELPLYEPYADMVKSKIADLKNIGGGSGGGTITAAMFLRPFVGDTPWAHLDIAGPSYTEKESRPDQPYGASGYGVRLLAHFLSGF